MSKLIPRRWSASRANAWWETKPWVCGCNFLPSSSVNFLEMWMSETFDPQTISRELNWAAEAGFNAVRVNLHFLLWLHERDALFAKVAWFLDTAAQLDIDVVLVPFDDCEFGGAEPIYGPQLDPVPFVHNSRAVASPGREAVLSGVQWREFEAYIKDLISEFKEDSRILFWDLYNEPGNLMIFNREGYSQYDPELIQSSRKLMIDAFTWAREVNPTQPLTVGAWRVPPPGDPSGPFEHEVDQLALELSDIITFHAYCDYSYAEQIINQLAKLNRPILSTEWMARAVGSHFLDQLALYRKHKVGCFNWGLVKGRTQTDLPWPDSLIQSHGQKIDGDVWFHDVFWPDGTPYDPAETRLIAELTEK